MENKQKLPVGISWNKLSKKYVAVVRLCNKIKHVGMFTTVEEAQRAQELAKKERDKFFW